MVVAARKEQPTRPIVRIVRFIALCILGFLMGITAGNLIGCSGPKPVCAPHSESVKLQASCDARQAALIVQGKCNSAPDVQHCTAVQSLRAVCAEKQKEWAHQCQ